MYSNSLARKLASDLRLSGLTKQLLLLASIEQNKISLTKKPFNFKTRVQEVVRDHMYAVNQKDIF